MIEIELKNLRKTYGSSSSGLRAVDDINLTIAPGEFFFLLGPSGCGKTTLLRMIAGLVEPTSGQIFFAGSDVTNLSVEKRNTAMVFQNYALWPHMTVGENVEFGPRMKGAGADERHQLAAENLARVQMDGLQGRKPNQLSGGQQQRVALARALAAQARCLLLDEPLSNLDARLRMHMRGEIRQLVKSTGTTGVYVTHDQKEALSMADRIAVMNAGRIIQIGQPQEIYNRPANRFVADFLGEANFLPGKVAAPGKTATVQTELGVVRAELRDGLVAGQSVTLCVRPESVHIQPASQPTPAGASALPAKVGASMYLGEIRQYICRLADQSATAWKVFVLADRAAPLEQGQDVMLTFQPTDATVLAD